jgi:hypothetical protein
VSDPTISGALPRWQVKHGFIALAVCILCAEGVVAGLDRSCMPSFDLSILSGQMLLLNIFFAPEIMGFVAGIPAFIIAAAPGSFDLSRRRLPLAFAGLGALVVVLAVVLRSGWSSLLFGGGILGAGALIGFWIRTIVEIRRFWFPFGVLLALTIGGLIFMFGHYGQNNCWP